jgi:cytochrome c-type biogenesis protein CcmF
LLIALLISAAVITFKGVKDIQYIVLLTTAIFAIVANGTILLNIIRGNYNLSGGAITHIGVALMLIGILFSSAYTKVVSINNSGLMISRSEEFTANDNKENKENITCGSISRKKWAITCSPGAMCAWSHATFRVTFQRAGSTL